MTILQQACARAFTWITWADRAVVAAEAVAATAAGVLQYDASSLSFSLWCLWFPLITLADEDVYKIIFLLAICKRFKCFFFSFVCCCCCFHFFVIHTTSIYKFLFLLLLIFLVWRRHLISLLFFFSRCNLFVVYV